MPTSRALLWLGQPSAAGCGRARDAPCLWAAGVSTPPSGHLPGTSLLPQLSTFVGGVKDPAVSPKPAGHFPKSACTRGGEGHCSPSIPERPLVLSWSHWAWYLRPSGDVSLPGLSPAGPISATRPGFSIFLSTLKKIFSSLSGCKTHPSDRVITDVCV